MGTGRLIDSDLARVLELVKDVPGDVAEVGVFRGHLFARLAHWSHAHGILAHAFDSFLGMGEPGPHDVGYPRGALSVGGPEAFVSGLERFHVERHWYRLWPGFVPTCFVGSDSLQFRLVYLDLDHYGPTVEAIEWARARLVPGGLLGFDDFFQGRDYGPSRAIAEAGIPAAAVVHQTTNNQIFFSLGTSKEAP